MSDENRFLVDPDIEKALILPREAFVSQEFLEKELETIFKRAWLLSPVEAPKQKGERAPFEMIGRHLVLVRDENNQLHALPNACTHKGSVLIEKRGCGPKKIICPYHGRRFYLNGKFAHHPGLKNAGKFPTECLDLFNFSVAEWFGLVFLCLGTPAFTFDEIFKTPTESLSNLPRPKLKLKKKMVIEGNWKYHIDNYIDELHLRFVHGKKGGLVDETKIESYTTELGRYSSLRWVYAKDPNDGFFHASFPKKEPLFALWWHVFPNLTINRYKWGISVNSYEPIPSDPNKTLLLIRHCVWDKYGYKRLAKKWKGMRVDKEDLEIVAKAQKVIRSTAFPRGPFVPAGERACHQFQRLIYEMTRA